ncbi:hypothetical protein [Halorussus marinus]|uniref:hypothetical protein n=1 Tax=Halorussus marinus TaxID=2505976 RepID=UPI00106EE4F0|nr:hypothetical protein [Halorussus marinus]
MDFLNGITEELGGRGDREAPNDTDRPAPESAPDDQPPTRDPERDSHATDRDDEHVCDFCGSDFEASRGRCPDCGAEIIVRGAR